MVNIELYLKTDMKAVLIITDSFNVSFHWKHNGFRNPVLLILLVDVAP